MLFHEFQESDCAYILLRGQVGIFRRSEESLIIPLAVLGSGEYLGEIGLIHQSVRSASAIALQDVEVLRIDKTEFEQSLKALPPWVQALIKTISQRLTEADQLISNSKMINPDLLREILPAIEKSEYLTQSTQSS